MTKLLSLPYFRTFIENIHNCTQIFLFCYSQYLSTSYTLSTFLSDVLKLRNLHNIVILHICIYASICRLNIILCLHLFQWPTGRCRHKRNALQNELIHWSK